MNKSVHISPFPKITILASLIVFCFVFGFYAGTRSEQDNIIKNKVVEVKKEEKKEWWEGEYSRSYLQGSSTLKNDLIFYENRTLGFSFEYPAKYGNIVMSSIKGDFPDNGSKHIVGELSFGLRFASQEIGFEPQGREIILPEERISFVEKKSATEWLKEVKRYSKNSTLFTNKNGISIIHIADENCSPVSTNNQCQRELFFGNDYLVPLKSKTFSRVVITLDPAQIPEYREILDSVKIY